MFMALFAGLAAKTAIEMILSGAAASVTLLCRVKGEKKKMIRITKRSDLDLLRDIPKVNEYVSQLLDYLLKEYGLYCPDRSIAAIGAIFFKEKLCFDVNYRLTYQIDFGIYIIKMYHNGQPDSHNLVSKQIKGGHIMKLQNYEFQPMEKPADTPEFELAISQALIASLKSRCLLTPQQAEKCVELLEGMILRSSHDKE